MAKGVTLTIKPGTAVKFEHARRGPRTGLLVEGVIIAVGSADKPIRFTSDALIPEHGDWGGIRFYPGSAGSIIDHCIVEYGLCAAYVADNVTITNSIIRWTTGTALALYSTATISYNRIYQPGSSCIEVHYRAQPTITYNMLWGGAQVSGIRVEANAHPVIRHNIIRDNKQSGIEITWSSSATVEYNLITGNGVGIGVGQEGSASNSVVRYNNIRDNLVADLSLNVSDILIATDNYWGTDNGATIDTKVQHILGGNVVYKPYASLPVEIGQLSYDFENNETYAHLPKTEYDTSEYIFAEDDETRTIVSSWKPPVGEDGIAWDGESLYVADPASPTDIIHKLDLSGNVVGSFQSPAVQTMGIAWDGQSLWVLDYTAKLVFQTDSSGKVIKSIPAPCDEPQGLTYDGKYLWTFSNQIQGKAYQFDTSGKTISTLQTGGFSGLAWDGKYLWINRPALGQLDQIDSSNGHVIRAITSSGVNTQYLTWQEPYLWAVEWADEITEHKRLVKILPSNERITLDGLKDDWQGFTPLLQDPPGDATGQKADIKAIYGFADENSLYLMLDFYELTDYSHLYIEVDVNNDGCKEYDVGGFFPGQPERSVFLRDYITGESRFIQYLIDYHGTELASNAKEVLELRVPLWLFQNKTDIYVRCFIMAETEDTSYVVDATDWAFVRQS